MWLQLACDDHNHKSNHVNGIYKGELENIEGLLVRGLKI